MEVVDKDRLAQYSDSARVGNVERTCRNRRVHLVSGHRKDFVSETHEKRLKKSVLLCLILLLLLLIGISPNRACLIA
jgi:hypothetical protein